jgi:hypothetical protein
MPTKPLHNLVGIPPISYLLEKLMCSYSLRLTGLPPTAKVQTVLVSDQCQYWPHYLCPTMNLFHVLQDLGPSTYCIPDLCTARSWFHKQLTYIKNPSALTTTFLCKEDLLHLSPGTFTSLLPLTPMTLNTLGSTILNICARLYINGLLMGLIKHRHYAKQL